MKTSRLTEYLYQYQWALLLIASPFLLFPSPHRSLFLLVFPLLFGIAWVVKREIFPLTPLNIPLLLIGGMLAVSVWATYDIDASLTKITGLLLGFLVFYTVVLYSRQVRGWLASLGVFFLFGSGVALLGILGTKWFSGKISLFDHLLKYLPTRLSGISGAPEGFQPNQVGGTLLWVLPLGLALCVFGLRYFLKKKSQRKEKLVAWMVLLMTAFMGFVFILTQSRGSYLGLGLSLVALSFFLVPRKWVWYLVPLIGVMALAGIWIVFSQGSRSDRASSSSDGVQDTTFSLESLQSREEIWSRALLAIEDYPITGMGMNNFRTVVRVLYPLYYIGDDFDIAHAHNEFLQAALDLGIPGLIAFLSLYIITFWMAIKTWLHLRSRDADLKLYILIGLAGGLLAHLIYSMTDAVALGAKPGFIFWMLLGLITGLYLQEYPAGEVVEPIG